MIFVEKIKDIYRKRHPDYILNINQDLLNPTQKRVLLCYINHALRIDFDHASIYHPNKLRSNQMILSLIKQGYAIDVCNFNDMFTYPMLSKRKYHAIIGFGPVYEALCENCSIPNRIIYVTENDPRIIEQKYKERQDYFLHRHPDKKRPPSSNRLQYYTARQFELSNKAIIMTCKCNSEQIRKEIPVFKTIKVNGLVNKNYSFSIGNIAERRKHFLWFGSTGYVQKGLDILVDVFRQLPEYHLHIYGLPSDELKSLSKISLPINVHSHGMVSIQTNEFLEVVNTNLFIISASCMEGMQSGVATCMRHGLIPLLTKECGYEAENGFTIFNDYHVDSIIEGIMTIQKKSDYELGQLSLSLYQYAEKEHTLGSFTNRFEEITRELLNEK